LIIEGFLKYSLLDDFMTQFLGFGSDNHSSVHPDILKAIIQANKEYTIAYGEDKYTKGAIKKIKDFFGHHVDVYFVYTGTAANILGLRNVTNTFHSIFCSDCAHLHVHECCGPENYIGCKLVTIPTSEGKLTVDAIKSHLVGINDPHMAQPKVISITQATELGTVYKPDEIKKISDFAHQHNMLIHMDGARLCNAAASLQVDFRTIATDVGVDVLSFGGTKNGMMYGEAVIFFNKQLASNFEFIRKQGMQLASKMRYISVQFYTLLSNDLWLKNAHHANEMAQVLYAELNGVPEITITQNVETNAVFAMIPKKYMPLLRKKYFFHVFDDQKSIVRFMCSFMTQKEDVLQLVKTIRNSIYRS
jgi:threonine aldolase